MLLGLLCCLSVSAQSFDPNQFFDPYFYKKSKLERFRLVISQAVELSDYDYSSAQQLVDTLKQYREHMELDELTELDFQIVASDVYRFAGNMELSRQHSQKVRHILKTLPRTNEHLNSVFDALITLGDEYRLLVQLDSAMLMYTQAGELAEQLEDSERMAIIYHDKAMIYEFHGAYEATLQNLFKILNVVDIERRATYITSTILNIASLYGTLGNYDLAEEYLAKHLDLVTDLGHEGLIAYSHATLATVKWEKGEHELAVEYMQKAAAIFEEQGFIAELNNAWIELGTYDVALGQLELAHQRLTTGKDYAQKEGIWELVIDAEYGLSDLALKRGNDADAEQQLLSALALTEEHGMTVEKMRTYERMVEFYDQTDNYKMAFETLSISKGMRDSLISVAKNFQINELQTQYETEQKEKQINEQQAALDYEKNKTLVITLILVLFALVLIITIYFYFKTKKIKDELSQLNRTKDRFFAIISHDLRGAVSGFKNIGEVLLHFLQKGDTESVEGIARNIDKNANNLNQLLDNLLNWSMQQLGEVPFNPKMLDLSLEIQKVTQLFNDIASAKEITFDEEVEEGLQLVADENSVQLILRNLLSNAIKFSNQGGHVHISAIKHKDAVQLTVKDSGVGITQQDIRGLFEIKSGHSSEGTSGEKGTGLGLNLCKHYTELHGGTIDVESTPNQGTKFTITIPQAA